MVDQGPMAEPKDRVKVIFCKGSVLISDKVRYFPRSVEFHNQMGTDATPDDINSPVMGTVNARFESPFTA
ncbi:hypothetical protein CXF95_13465 [Paraglaciecola sp. MB-3u-78]|jgi:hypothetical protein|nr:hypothetical protein CXF95_13465 [Paraglaciecola sp. MB-3u-78]